MFIRVLDAGQNLDSTAIDTLNIVITADNGDMITMRLYESGPDTGEFFAYLPSTQLETPINDPVITGNGNTSLTATYIDIFDSTDVTVDTAILNPLNRVFSSVTGELVDGATVTLINNDTGEEAVVYGVDGFSSFPSDVISGTDATDTSGLIYDNDAGEFRFPLVEAGNYTIRVDPPEGYTFSSTLSPDAFDDSNPNGFVLLPISFGDVLSLTTGGPLRFDIPLDPESDIIVQKQADRTFGDVGERRAKQLR